MDEIGMGGAKGLNSDGLNSCHASGVGAPYSGYLSSSLARSGVPFAQAAHHLAAQLCASALCASALPSSTLFLYVSTASLFVSDPELSAQVFLGKLNNKQQLYFPIKRLHESLNCKLSFVDPEITRKIITLDLQDIIVCLHLVAVYLQANCEGKFVPFINAHDVQTRVGKLAEGWYQLVRARVPTCHLINNQQLGVWLVQQCQVLFADGQFGPHTTHRKRFVVESPNHAMALTLRRKVKFGVEHHVLTFYDPNITSNHVRKVALKPHDFSELKLQDLMPENCYLHYFPDGEQHSMLYELPELDQEQFSMEELKDAVDVSPKPSKRLLASSLGVDWQQLNCIYVNDFLKFKIGNLSFYRHLFGLFPPEENGDALWEKSADLEASKAIRWDSFDGQNLRQWLALEMLEFQADKGNYDDFRGTLQNTIDLLPQVLRFEASLILFELLEEGFSKKTSA